MCLSRVSFTTSGVLVVASSLVIQPDPEVCDPTGRIRLDWLSGRDYSFSLHQVEHHTTNSKYP